MTDAPCTAAEAVTRAQSLVNNGGQYLLGTGDYSPFKPTDTEGVSAFIDLPWTVKSWEQGSDCAGFAICWCWKLRRHRPGFNHGIWASVEDDLNVNSIMEDADHKQELTAGSVAHLPEPGDLLCYPTFRLPGVLRPFIGHVAIIEKVSPAFVAGRYDLLTIIQCHGPDHFKPGVVRTDGSLFMHHDMLWPGTNNAKRRSKIIRMKERK